ncbi:hypothetical protein [Streptomyces sp. NPDC018833]|uniref:hypothetical protein n=1 Tax=Streptomyces sp. NPDC018833 TaxID=3365053 RepID=UPI0037BC276D
MEDDPVLGADGHRRQNIPPAAERWMARRAGSHTTEVNASHAVAASRPAVVTDVILDVVRGTC